MKFEIIVDATSKRIKCVPETDVEQRLLAFMQDDGQPKLSDGRQVAEATVSFKLSSDRPPYQKVTEMEIKL